MRPIATELSRYQLLKERLTAAYADIDEETLSDTLEGITNLHEMIAAVIRSALVDEALELGLRSRLDDMRKRLGRLEERGFKKRQLAVDALCEAGLKKLEQPDFTASARAGTPYLVVTAEEAIPQVPQFTGSRSRQSLIVKQSLASSSGAPSYPARNSATRNQCSR